MADNAQLDAFLTGGAPQEGAPEPAAAPPAPEPPKEPAGATAAPGKPPEAAAKAPEAEPEDEPQPHTGSDNRTVPFSALEKVRNDWKSKYAAEQARAELLAKQLEEARKPPPPVQQQAPQPQYIPPPDPAQDPQGYHQRVQGVILNERLNTSEMLLREKVGDDAVDALITEFQQAAKADPTLYGKLYQQTRPYQWAAKEVEAMRLRRDIGDDPAAYRARIEAEARAKWEAEAGQQPNGANGHAPSPAAGLPPSLASARSVAGRTASPFTGPPPLEALFPGHNRRTEQRR